MYCDAMQFNVFMRLHGAAVCHVMLNSMQMGILTVQEYLQYYLKDAIGPIYSLNGVVVATTPQKAVAVLFVPILFGIFSPTISVSFCTDAARALLSPFLFRRSTYWCTLLCISATPPLHCPNVLLCLWSALVTAFFRIVRRFGFFVAFRFHFGPVRRAA